MAKGSARVDAQVEGLDEALKKLASTSTEIRAALKQAVRAGARVMADAISPLAPHPEIETGQFVAKPSQGIVEGSIGPKKRDWHWRFLESGAKPHEIKAKKGRYLVFAGDEGTVRVRSVAHPGIKPKPFMRPGFERATAGDAQQAVADSVRQAVES